MKNKKLIGYIPLYGNGFLHWAGSLYKTEKEASEYKSKKSKHKWIGEVFINIREPK